MPLLHFYTNIRVYIQYPHINNYPQYKYLSPCFKLRNCLGNPCLHALPNTAVSSSALYCLADRKISPALKSLQS